MSQNIVKDTMYIIQLFVVTVATILCLKKILPLKLPYHNAVWSIKTVCQQHIYLKNLMQIILGDILLHIPQGGDVSNLELVANCKKWSN